LVKVCKFISIGMFLHGIINRDHMEGDVKSEASRCQSLNGICFFVFYYPFFTRSHGCWYKFHVSRRHWP